MCKIYLKLTIKTPEQCGSGVFIVNFEQISHNILVFPLFPYDCLGKGLEIRILKLAKS